MIICDIGENSFCERFHRGCDITQSKAASVCQATEETSKHASEII